MLEEIKTILQNANCFANSDYKHEVHEMIDILIKYSLESGININDLREQLYKIKFNIE